MTAVLTPQRGPHTSDTRYDFPLYGNVAYRWRWEHDDGSDLIFGVGAGPMMQVRVTPVWELDPDTLTVSHTGEKRRDLERVRSPPHRRVRQPADSRRAEDPLRGDVASAAMAALHGAADRHGRVGILGLTVHNFRSLQKVVSRHFGEVGREPVDHDVWSSGGAGAAGVVGGVGTVDGGRNLPLDQDSRCCAISSSVRPRRDASCSFRNASRA